ncbi:MAG TPA: ABC-F family ATP-binding cassette domain-containing protein [Phycisphaerales bacterium]|nr:ABC-F family ATP-binding cassette domain-containing protein [Phycisphaerales bacterium]HMP35985.1 ABC-F family ATP-binding cassette domain-containing protein [Phycisphaerales bacterium]
MPLLSVNALRHAYGTAIVLEEATFSIEPGEKVGLVGRNGGGKSTLMRIVAGLIDPDGGTVSLQRGARVGYLSQEPAFDPDETLRGAAEGAFAELHRLHQELERVFEAMATAQGDELERLMRRQVDLEHRMEAAGGYAIDHRIDATLHGLGFVDAQFGLKVAALSGGQRGRLGLARLLLEEPDLLLLDEPTNHLDIAGREWLENFLAEEYHGAVVVVSHDRWLLDRVASRILEVDQGGLREYPGNYAKFIELRRERQLTQQRDWQKRMDKVKSEEAFIMRYKAGQRAKQARGRATRLERFKAGISDRPLELDVMNLRLPEPPRVGDSIVVAEGISKAYGTKALFHDLDLRIAPGDRIGIIGPNGAGKTTLVRALLGEIAPDAGTLRLSPRASIGYLRQTHDHLDRQQRVWQYLQSVIVSLEGGARASEQQARDLAGAFLFSGSDQEKAVGDLSGGEKMRMVLAGLMAGAKNLLVLDEPTNHLDIPSAERLEQTLAKDDEDGGYAGALLLISHDRALLESTCDRLIVLDGHGGSRVFDGTYTDWRDAERRDQAARDAAARAVAEAEARRQSAAAARQRAEAEAAEKARKAKEPGARGGGKGGGRGGQGAAGAMSLESLESRLEAIEERLRALDAQMVDPKVYADRQRFRALEEDRAKLVAEQAPLEAEWARRAES